MLTVIAFLTLAQVVTTGGAGVAVSPTWGSPVEWTQRGEKMQAWLNPVLVAERGTQLGAALRELDPTATLEVDRPLMRIWRVSNAAAVRARLPALLPVLHDLPSSASRLRVPVGVVCGAVRGAVSGLAALERVSSNAECVPDFWMKSVAK